MRHVISAVVMNEPGVLANAAGMCDDRGSDADSLVVERTHNPKLTRTTILANADDNTVAQDRKPLANLVPVVGVHAFRGSTYAEYALILITATATPEKHSE